VPFLKEKVKDCKVAGAPIWEVQVGSVLHPMLPEHWINWIGSFSNNTWVIKWLNPGDEPKHSLRINSDSTVYEYCNLHGLWKK
jgi:superoxide reductase